MAGKTAYIYRVIDETEAARKAKRWMHKKKEKSSAKSMVAEGNGTIIGLLPAEDMQNPAVIVTDVFKLLQVLRASKKIFSIAFSPSNPPKGSLATLSLSLNNNMLETYSVHSEKVSKMYSIEMHGHGSDIRSVSLNSEDPVQETSSIEVIEAHAGSIRSIIPISDKDGNVGARGFVTGSADHDVKFWEYQWMQKS
jgi:U3 small nucleolar RNA-associated protein 12